MHVLGTRGDESGREGALFIMPSLHRLASSSFPAGGSMHREAQFHNIQIVAAGTVSVDPVSHNDNPANIYHHLIAQ